MIKYHTEADGSHEEWRQIAAYPDYAVSSIGNVKRIRADTRGRIRLRPYIRGTVTYRGYRQLTLWRGGSQHCIMLHIVVCTTFHGDPPTPEHMVAHGDGKSLNNTAANLRWATSLENEHDKRLHGTVACGERQGAAKLTQEDVIAIRQDVRSQKAIAADYGITQANVSFIVRRKSWRHLP